MDSRKRTRVESSDDELQVESINKGGGGGGGGDRISDLCDAILHHIFSFLPTREVIQTCVLSKRWRNLWCSVPWLDFDEETFLASSSSSSSTSSRTDQLHAAAAGVSFSTFVNYAMLLRDGSNIQKFRLSCSYDNTSSSHAFQYYIVTAIRHKLRVLDFKILQHHQAAENVLPSSLFTCESLTCLKLNNVVLPSYYYSSNFWLKTLHLISVKFPGNRLSTESLFSNSRNLETLTIENCNSEHLKRFQISALQLKNLIIIQDDEDAPSSSPNNMSVTLVSAPNLTSLKIHAQMQSRWYLIYNLNSLVEADIHLKNPSSTYISSSFMIGIFSQLNNAEAITLSGSCLQLIEKEELLSAPVETIKSQLANILSLRFSSPDETTKSQLANILRLRFIESKENPFPNLKSMKLKTWFEDEEVGAITDLLKRSPNVETLVIEYNSESSYEENELPLREEKLPSECTLHHLKTIQMRGFGGRKNEVKLLTFLLENAKSLKKMIVEEAST